MTSAILSVRNLQAHYEARRVLQGASLDVLPGEWFSLLGPNGCGKTTLLRCVSGQLRPTGGNVLIGGQSVHRNPELAKRKLGFAHPPEQLPGLLSGRQCLEVYAGAFGLPTIGTATLAFARQLGMGLALDQLVYTYSLGMRQKLSILLALINDPALIVLDEIFNGLDPASAVTVKAELRRRVEASSAVLLATHALDLVMRCSTRAALLLNGVLAKSWDERRLAALRAQGIDALELELADAADSVAET